jgi:DNA adenine methylase
MEKAVTSGKILENNVKLYIHDTLKMLLVDSKSKLCKICNKKCSNINFYQHYKTVDIYGESLVDFYFNFNNIAYFIEVKNQNVAGSVDQKIPYYIENLRQGYYNGRLIFIFSKNYTRNGMLEYLNNVSQQLPVYIYFDDNIKLFEKLLYNNENCLDLQYSLKYKPVLRYAGGKSSIVSQIIKYFPIDFNDYHEFFAGSLSVACGLHNEGFFKKETKIYINDIVEPLIVFYDKLRNCKNSLFKVIKMLDNVDISKEYYEDIRKKFNELKSSPIYNEGNLLNIASYYYFLNKTCFNGIYRENASGGFNVPYGKYDGKKVLNFKLLEQFHKFLNLYQCIFLDNSYQECIKSVKPGDLVYLDPPYHKSFTSYHKSGFIEKDQTNLKEIVDKLTDIGAYVVVSNSNTDFIRELYKDYNVYDILVNRNIAAKISSRKETKEVLITNF